MQPDAGPTEPERQPRRLSVVRAAPEPDGGPGDSSAGGEPDRRTRSYDLSQASPEGLRQLYRALLEGFTDGERARLETLIADNVTRLREDGDNFA